jgi:hypothetical protein
MANPSSNSSKAAVQRDVLAAAGGKLKSIDDHAYAYHTRNVFFKATAAFAGCLSPVLQANVLAARLFCLPRLQQLSDLQRCCLAFAGFALDPIVRLLLSLRAVNSKEAHSRLTGPSRYVHSLAHISLEPCVDRTEEGLEQWVGRRKAHIKDRGAHRHQDIVREGLADERAARARADYGLEERRRPKEASEPSQAYVRGLVLVGNALSNTDLRAAFAAARRRVPADLRAYFVELPSQWLISSCLADELAVMEWAQLVESHDVMCLCDRDCDHV